MRRMAWGGFIVAVAAILALAYYRLVLRAPEPTLHWARSGSTYELLEPRTLGLVLVAPLLLFVLGRSLADLPWSQRALSVLLRIAFIGLLAVGLARLGRTADAHKVCAVYLLDVSDSASDESVQEGRHEVERALAAKPKDDLLRLVTFARRPRSVELGDPAALPSVQDLRHPKGGAGSDLQAALELAYGLFPQGYLKRAVLLTDGVETDGDVLAEANRARGFGVRVSTIPYRRPAPGEIAVRGLRVPDKVEIGQPFDVIADVYASRKSRARARLFQGEMLNGLDGVREIDLAPGANEITFKSVVRVGGEVTYALDVDPLGEDKFRENNRYAATVDVPGRPNVLYVDGQPERASYLSNALSAQQFDVDVRPASSMPGSLKELERYDFVILSDVPAERVSPSAQDLIEKYVRDLGGGFLFAGGAAGYGLGGWAHTTIERILPVRMDVERKKDMPSVAMVLVIDRSGSMTGLPIEMAKAACKATVGTLAGDDLIEIIAFDSTPTRYVKMQPAKYRSRIQNEILRILPGGGTEIRSAVDMAYGDISVVQARKKHVILLTDGRAESAGLKDLAQAMLAESITLTTVALGDGADLDLLRTLADAGGGRFHHVPDPNSLPRIFTRETELVSRQAAVEEWFPVTQTAPADFLRGIAIASAPLLHGYVATQMKAPPAQQILASDQGEPILARWRVGLGQAIAWTSDVKNLWAADWLRWSGFGKFWGQLVREHMRQKHRRELDMKTEVAGDRVRAVVDAFTADERFDNDMVGKLLVIGPEPGGDRREVAMRQTAPGRYEADFRLDRYGSFLLRAEQNRVGKNGGLERVGGSFGHVSNPYPREYASFEPAVDGLTRAALAGGGSVDPAPAEVFDPRDEKIVYRQELWPRFILAAIAVFLLDLLVRRVRLFDRKHVARRPVATRVRPHPRSRAG